MVGMDARFFVDAVRSIDVAHYLGFTKPSVSRAMSLLRQNGYVVMEADGSLELTGTGLAIAEPIYERHCMLTEWLVALGVSPETAARDACRMEHRDLHGTPSLVRFSYCSCFFNLQ